MLSSAFSLRGQENNFTFQFSRILFSDLVDTIEKKIPVRIYYSSRWTDSLYLKVNAENSSLDGVLDKALRRDGLSFMITDDNRIILSKGYSIKTGFAKEYAGYLSERYASDAAAEFIRPVIPTEESAISDEYRLFRIGRPSATDKPERVTLTGVVTDDSDGEGIPSVVVYVDKLKSGAMTNNVGFYSIALPPGQYRIEYRMIGMKTASRNVLIYSDGSLDVSMAESPSLLNEVIVSANRDNNVRNTRIGIEKINVKMLKQIPLGLGETGLPAESSPTAPAYRPWVRLPAGSMCAAEAPTRTLYC
ncbi:MAG: carboxypeptidase-like regulatory domain-containing protein [Bacteroidales bacterium]|nr:carboxypeptidase-like regulatory domain-containing protein [Bacteroidales bacterium]